MNVNTTQRSRTSAPLLLREELRSTPLLVHWIIYQSDQLGEVGVCWKGTLKTLAKEEKVGRWHFGRIPKIEGVGVLIGQRANTFGITLP